MDGPMDGHRPTPLMEGGRRGSPDTRTRASHNPARGAGSRRMASDRKLRQLQRREADILGAALDLAARGDWNSVTIDQIAERADIGKGTLYTHFRSKDEVCARLVVESKQSLLRKLEAIPVKLPVMERVRMILRIVWKHNVDNTVHMHLGEYCELNGEQLTLGEDSAAEMKHIQKALHAFFYGIIEEGVAQGVFPDKPADYMLLSGEGALSGAMRLVRSGACPGIDQEAYLEYLIDFILSGLINPAASVEVAS